MIKLGVNVFSLRNNICNDDIKIWEEISFIGYDNVELMAYPNRDEILSAYNERQQKYIIEQLLYFMNDYAQMKNKILALRRCGLSVYSIHVFLTEIGWKNPINFAKALITLGKKINVKYFVVGSPTYTENIEGIANILREISNQLHENGMKLVYHAHGAEWGKYKESTYIDYLLNVCENMLVEPDVGWAYFAGQDICVFLEKYKDRIAFIHLKDMNVVEGKPKFTAVGQGCVPMKEVLDFSRKYQFENKLIIDQDESEDIIADLKMSRDYIINTLQERE